MTGTSAALQATCRTSACRSHRTAGRKARYSRFSVLPRPEIYGNLRIKDDVKIDPSCRPEIKSKIENMAQYDVVFVGFPVWWYREPSIIDTFMESYDFAGKTVVPFATSGMSPVGDAGRNMQALGPGAGIAAGKRFPGGASAAELAKWAAEWV